MSYALSCNRRSVSKLSCIPAEREGLEAGGSSEDKTLNVVLVRITCVCNSSCSGR